MAALTELRKEVPYVWGAPQGRGILAGAGSFTQARDSDTWAACRESGLPLTTVRLVGERNTPHLQTFDEGQGAGHESHTSCSTATSRGGHATEARARAHTAPVLSQHFIDRNLSAVRTTPCGDIEPVEASLSADPGFPDAITRTGISARALARCSSAYRQRGTSSSPARTTPEQRAAIVNCGGAWRKSVPAFGSATNSGPKPRAVASGAAGHRNGEELGPTNFQPREVSFEDALQVQSELGYRVRFEWRSASPASRTGGPLRSKQDGGSKLRGSDAVRIDGLPRHQSCCDRPFQAGPGVLHRSDPGSGAGRVSRLRFKSTSIDSISNFTKEKETADSHEAGASTPAPQVSPARQRGSRQRRRSFTAGWVDLRFTAGRAGAQRGPISLCRVGSSPTPATSLRTREPRAAKHPAPHLTPRAMTWSTSFCSATFSPAPQMIPNRCRDRKPVWQWEARMDAAGSDIPAQEAPNRARATGSSQDVKPGQAVPHTEGPNQGAAGTFPAQVMPAWAGTVTRNQSERAKTADRLPGWTRKERGPGPQGIVRGEKLRDGLRHGLGASTIAARLSEPVRLRRAGTDLRTGGGATDRARPATAGGLSTARSVCRDIRDYRGPNPATSAIVPAQVMPEHGLYKWAAVKSPSVRVGTEAAGPCAGTSTTQTPAVLRPAARVADYEPGWDAPCPAELDIPHVDGGTSQGVQRCTIGSSLYRPSQLACRGGQLAERSAVPAASEASPRRARANSPQRARRIA